MTSIDLTTQKQQVPGKPHDTAYALPSYPRSDVWSMLIKITKNT